MKVSVIGAGALGKAYGGLLSLGGHDVHYLMRSEFNEIKEAGFFALKFNETGKTIKITNAPKQFKLFGGIFKMTVVVIIFNRV